VSWKLIGGVDMGKKKNRKTCEKCGASVNIHNYSNHMLKAHGLHSSSGSGRNKIMIISALLIVVLIAVAWNFTSTSEVKQVTSTPAISENSDNRASTEESAVNIPISEISSSAKWYKYEGARAYFVVKGSDEKIHLAIDACDVCYSVKLGYKQTGDVMTCNNCGQTFPINSLGTENLTGGCWPSYLPYEVDSENVIISKSEIEQKQFMFQ
jgi:uncharacterized membrane protein